MARPRFVPGRIIVKFSTSAEAPAPNAGASLKLNGLTFQQADVLPEGAEIWTLSSGDALENHSLADQEQLTLEAVEELRARPEVAYAHVDLYMDYLSVPTDSLYGLQWHYPAIHLPEAWQTVTGNVKIAVLDTGKLAHPDLVDRWAPGYDFGYETVGVSDPDPTSDGRWHHGLHVAGILGAKWDNDGVAGVCRDCPLMPVKISSTTNRPLMTNVSRAIDWSVQNGAKVINMSFGTLAPAVEPCVDYPLLQAAITRANTAGVVVVAAAGNDSRDPSSVIPASCAGVISVAASMPNGQLAPYSNRGPSVSLTAPGGGPDNYGNGILCNDLTPMAPYNGLGGAVSAWAVSKPGPTVSGADFCHRYLGGTSMAAPHVAGVAALIMTQRPHWTAAQVTQRLLQAVNPVPGCPANTCGAGMLDASKAIITSPQFSAPTCTTSSGALVGSFSCTVGWMSGGLPPYSQVWSSVSNLTITASTPTTVQGTCTPDTDAVVRITAQDSEGTSLGYDKTFRCPASIYSANPAFQEVPTQVLAARLYNVAVTMNNTGSVPWTAAEGFRLHAIAPSGNNSFWGIADVELDPGESIAPHQNKTFRFAITTPYAAGVHDFQWQMVKDGHGFFGLPSPLTPISVTVPLRDSVFVRQSVPTTVVVGSTFHTTFTMKNTGSDTWSAANFYRLGSQPAASNTWGQQRFYLNPTDVATRGQELTFSGSLTAPTTPGVYRMLWRMTQDGLGDANYFGASTEPVDVTVVLPPRNSVFVQQEGPTTVMAGMPFVYTVKMRNTGTQPWRADTGFSLRNLSSSTWSNSHGSLAPGEEIAPGQEKTFTVTVNAPAAAGSHQLMWRMLQTQAGQFGQATPGVTIDVLPRADAAFVRQTVPARVLPGQSFPVTITLKNSGNATWGDLPGYQLVPLPNLQANNWGQPSVPLEAGERVLPGGEKTFSFTATAPTTQGPHAFQWRMRLRLAPRIFIDFGEVSTLVNVLVTDRCYCPPGEVCPDVDCTPPVEM